MSSIATEKEALRSKVLSQRLKMTTKLWEQKSERIIDKVLSLKCIQEAECIHTYVSMNDRKEVGTDSFIEQLFELGKKVVVPLSNFEDLSLTHGYIEPDTQFKTNKWGVREPVQYREAKMSELDVVIVPMAAGDESGNRLGYGKGFYDRFLSQLDAHKIGLLFDAFLLSEIPTDEFDVKLDRIISEEREIFA